MPIVKSDSEALVNKAKKINKEEKRKQEENDYAHLDKDALQLMLSLEDNETEDAILDTQDSSCCGAIIQSICGACWSTTCYSCKLCLNAICCGIPCGTMICGTIDVVNKTSKKVTNSGML